MRRKYASAALVLPLVLVGCNDDGEDAEYNVQGTVEHRQVDYDCGKAHAMAPVTFGIITKPGPKTKPDLPATDGNKTKAKAPKPLHIPNGAVPTPSFPKKPKGMKCTTEYELFVRNSDGLFEEDVTSRHYEKCTLSKRFPACAK